MSASEAWTRSSYALCVAGLLYGSLAGCSDSRAAATVPSDSTSAAASKSESPARDAASIRGDAVSAAKSAPTAASSVHAANKIIDLRSVPKHLAASGNAKATATLATPDSETSPAGNAEVSEEIADDKDGLPVPKNYTSYVNENSTFRRNMSATVPGDIATVVSFYDREMMQRGWKSSADKPAGSEKETKRTYVKDEAKVQVTLRTESDEVRIEISSRDEQAAKSAGLLPESGKCRVMLGNAFDKDATILINGRSHKVAAGKGAKNPAEAISIHLPPGNCKLTVQVAGAADESETLEFHADETWGVIVIPTGGYMAQQLY